MAIYITKELWERHLKEYVFVGVAVRDKNIVYFSMRRRYSDDVDSRKWDSEIETLQVAVYLDTPNSSFGLRTLLGYNHPVLGVSRKPVAQSLLASRNRDGQVSVFGGGRNQPDEMIAPGKFPMPQRIKCIDGYAYSVGDFRQIYKRTAIGRWELFSEPVASSENVSQYGFSDFDGFDDSDMYAVGGRGEVWHFNGKQWSRCGFPSNVQLATVTCAPDGVVYVSGEGGSLWRGRQSKWTSIHKGVSTVLWNDSVWFKGKLWLSSDYQFQILDGGSLVDVTYDEASGGGRVFISGRMDACDDLLVIASTDVAMAFDGQSWRTVIGPYL